MPAETRGDCCRFRREHAHVEQEGPELCRIGNRKGLESPTVVAANGEVHTKEEATVHVKELDLCVTVQVLDDTPAVSFTLENSAKITDIPTNGPLARSHSSVKMADG